MGSKKGRPIPSEKKIDPGIVTIRVAIISLAGTIITLLFTFPPFHRLFEPRPTTTWTSATALDVTITPSYIATICNTSTIESAFTETRNPTSSDTPIPALPIETMTATFTPIPGLPTGMQVVLYANLTSGKAPLPVKLDARSSYFRDSTGAVFPCGACNYTWQIRQGSEMIYGPEKGQGTFEFRFGAKGTYFVSVFVCRSNSTTDCGGSGSLVVVK